MRRSDTDIFAALLARVGDARLHALSLGMLSGELDVVHETLTDVLTAMRRLQEVQIRVATLEREQAAIGIPSGRTDRVMTLVDETQHLHEQLLGAIARFPELPLPLQVSCICDVCGAAWGWYEANAGV